MRLGFFGQTGPYAPLALRHLVTSRAELTPVVVVEGKRHPSGRHPHRLLEAPGQAREVLPRTEMLAHLAHAAGIPVYETADVNAPDAIRALRRFDLDFMVCVGFDRLFSPELLGVTRRGGINCHPSRLPALRGPAPIFWALRNGARSLGVSIHGLDPQEDHGPIFAQEGFVLPHLASTGDIYRIAGDLAGRMLSELLPGMADGTAPSEPQDHSRATRAPRPKAEDAYFEPERWSCQALLNFACAAPFSRAAWTRLGDDTFHVRRGIGFEADRKLPAQYILQDARLFVQCRDGVAELEIQT